MRAILGLILLAGVLAGYAVLQQVPASSDSNADQGRPWEYFVLAISWTPSWCVQTGDARDDARCADGAGAGWLVHGLWPQNSDGSWPEYCDTVQAAPRPEQISAMIDIMGSEGLALHQWRKHGTCTGESAEGYFALMRRAFEAMRMPSDADMTQSRVSPMLVLEQIMRKNPGLKRDMAVVTCQGGNLQEIRVCLMPSLAPRSCDDRLLARSCRSANVSVPAIR